MEWLGRSLNQESSDEENEKENVLQILGLVKSCLIT